MRAAVAGLAVACSQRPLDGVPTRAKEERLLPAAAERPKPARKPARVLVTVVDGDTH